MYTTGASVQQTSEFEVAPSAPSSNHISTPAPVVIQMADHRAPGGGPRASKRTQWIRLADAEDHEYHDHQILAKINYPDDLNARFFASGSMGTIRDGLKRIVFEHNGWIDTDTDEELPPISQPCRREAAFAEAVKGEAASYATAIKGTKTASAKAAAEQAHDLAEQKIRDEVSKQQDELPGRCCFWDAIDQNEVILMIRAINDTKQAALSFLLDKRTSSAST